MNEQSLLVIVFKFSHDFVNDILIVTSRIFSIHLILHQIIAKKVSKILIELIELDTNFNLITTFTCVYFRPDQCIETFPYATFCLLRL